MFEWLELSGTGIAAAWRWLRDRHRVVVTVLYRSNTPARDTLLVAGDGARTKQTDDLGIAVIKRNWSPISVRRPQSGEVLAIVEIPRGMKSRTIYVD